MRSMLPGQLTEVMPLLVRSRASEVNITLIRSYVIGWWLYSFPWFLDGHTIFISNEGPSGEEEVFWDNRPTVFSVAGRRRRSRVLRRSRVSDLWRFKLHIEADIRGQLVLEGKTKVIFVLNGSSSVQRSLLSGRRCFNSSIVMSA